jgi:hypothetical protein
LEEGCFRDYLGDTVRAVCLFGLGQLGCFCQCYLSRWSAGSQAVDIVDMNSQPILLPGASAVLVATPLTDTLSVLPPCALRCCAVLCCAPQEAGLATRNHVKRARQLGVTVFAPSDPPEAPAPGTAHIVLVTKAQMERCAYVNS